MPAFIVKRFLSFIPVLLAVTFLTFLLINLSPGDFLATISLDPSVSAERVARLRHDFGLDEPWYEQYALWLYRLSPFQFPVGLKWPDLGYSFTNKTPVMNLMKERFVNTLILTTSAEAFIWFIAIPLGVLSAIKRKTWIEKLTSFGVLVGISLPEILLALLALLLAAKTGWFPVGGMHSLNFENLNFIQRTRDLLWHLVLPTLVLGVTGIAGITRYMRASLLDTLSADYIRTARAKGLKENEVIRHHAFRNAINPVITLFGISFANLISASFLVEIIMGWPGVGKLMYEAILAKDLYVIMASLIVATVFLMIGNLIADLLLALSDPRIRYE